ncbi:MAG: hypothetical protein ACREK9_22600 [Candidatus Rokuibacteriota bacterium]
MNYESLARSSALAWIGRPTLRLVHAADPTRLRLRSLRKTVAQPAGLICIYRTRYASQVSRLVTDARGLGLEVVLWGLDAVIPSLSRLTIGTGPGARLALLNRLYKALPPSASGQIVVSDDDVEFVRGGLQELLCVAHESDFGLAQPVHAPGSHVNQGITRARPLTLARLTTFVDVGPVLVISRELRSRVLPFPEEFGMGWGLSLLWTDLSRSGCRLGQVDAVSVRHLAPAGREYEIGPEAERLRAMMKARNIESLESLRRTLAAWRVWQTKPPWAHAPREH